MNNYIIYTDSACDVSTSLLREWGVCVSSSAFDLTTRIGSTQMRKCRSRNSMKRCGKASVQKPLR